MYFLKVRRIIHRSYTTFATQQRDPRYIFVLFFASVFYILTAFQATHQGLFDSFERPFFSAINALPSYLGPVMYVGTQFGGLGALFFWITSGWYLAGKRAAVLVAGSGIAGWFLAKLVKASVHRGRPQEFITDIQIFGQETFGGYGFPSGHATFSAACATVLYYQVHPRYRKYILAILLLVGISRMYLGAHFPLDIVGGWALGAFIGAVVVLFFGASRNIISAPKLKRILRNKGYDIAHLRYAKLDARGSTPIFMQEVTGRKLFGKIFGKQEHAADWLFKIMRLVRYKDMQAEEPYLNSRYNMIMESHATMWAKKVGVRTSQIVDLIPVGTRWLLIQEMLDAKPLHELKRVRQTSLEDVWRQVKKLHAGNIAHRDLRAANVMVDKQGRAWLIDFGFAQISPTTKRQHMDRAELLMSMALAVGPKRTVAAAAKIINKDDLRRTMPYLQKTVFSNATRHKLRHNKNVMEELRSHLIEKLDIKREIEAADIVRFNRKKILNIVLLALFVYIVIPQFKEFRGAFALLDSLNYVWLLPLALFSALTYLFSGIIMVMLSDVPLRIRESAAVQLAASLLSKIVPGGLGSKGLNARYFKNSGMDAGQISAVLFAESLIGFIMFIIPLAFVLLTQGQSVAKLLTFNPKPSQVLAVNVLLAGIGIICYVWPKLRRRIVELGTDFINNIKALTTSPGELALSALFSSAVTAAYVLCLVSAMHAFGVQLSITTAFLVYATAIIAKSAVPTPGGLGPLEVALAASMIGFGVVQPTAYAVVVLYRLATFWIPIPFAALSYRYLLAKKII